MGDLRERLARLSPEQRAALSRSLAGGEKTYPLSPMQRRLWFLERLTPGTTAYLVPAAVRLRGTLDPAVMSAAVAALVARHETLRTTFHDHEGGPVQVVAPRLDLPVPVEDFRDRPEADRHSAVQERIAQLTSTPFDLAAGPLLRLVLLRTDDQEHLLVVVLHHIVSDGWSVSLLFGELVTLYEAFVEQRPNPLTPLRLQYGDVARTQKPPRTEDLSFWRENLAGAPPFLELTPDHPRSPVQSFRGASWALDVPPELTQELGELGRRHGATPFMVLLALFQVLLHRHSGQDDLVVGIPVANRADAAQENMIGFFANTLPIRVDLSGEPSFVGVLERVRESCLQAYAHQGVPFDRLVEELRPVRDLSRSPVVQVSFAYQSQPLPTTEVAGLELSRVGLPSRSARFDLELQLVEDEGGLSGLIEYNSDLYQETSVRRLGAHLLRLAGAAISDPDRPIGRLDLIGEAQRRAVHALGAAVPPHWPPPPPVHLRIAGQAGLTPDSEAVRCQGESLTYAELDQRANQLAHRLRREGVGRDVLVGLCLARSVEMVVAMLAVHKAGGAYLPLDPVYPPARLAFMLRDSGAAIVLTQTRVREQVASGAATVICLDDPAEKLAGEEAGAPDVGVADRDLAYVIYTSGSTGRPKGVAIEHRALANFLRSMQEHPGIAAHDVLLAVTSLSFDISGLELLLPLVAGARVVIATQEVASDGAALARELSASGATLMQATPSTWRMLVESGWAGGTGLRMLCGGEALPPALAGQLLGRGAGLWNMYGPTETTIWSAQWQVRPGPIALGEAVADTDLHVLDRYGQLVPPGIPGELHIGGAGLARGYLNRPEVTAERFVERPGAARPGERLYRTGDLVRRRGDGSLEFLGRTDHQVKIRGFRIELGEIERILEDHPAVGAAVVSAREHAGDARLVAHLACPGEPAPPAAELTAFLRERLPSYMIPAAFVVLDRFPLTPNGKLDRALLPEADFGRDGLGPPYRQPQGPLEQAVAQTFEAVLGVERVGADDDFFALGGHSLLATRTVTRLRPLLGTEVALRELFECPTAAGLAARLTQRGVTRQDQTSSGAPPTPVVTRREDPAQPVPLAAGQRRLWFLEQLSPGSQAYVMPAALRVHGRLDTQAFARACQEVVRRHEILRAVFPEIDGQPRMVIRPHIGFSPAVVDLNGPGMLLESVSQAFFEQRFDLAQGPLLRVEVLRVGPDESVLLVALHHIVADQWSLGVLLGEVLARYAEHNTGQPAQLPDLPVQYPDFALWQQHQENSDGVQHWVRTLQGAPEELALSTARPRPAEKSYRGGVLPVRIPAPLVRELRTLGEQERKTLFMVLTAAFQVVLGRLADSEDVVVGTPVANRRLSELEPLIGLFVNTLALRTDLSGEPTFRELLHRVGAVCLEAYEHQDVPFEAVVQALRPQRSLARTPVFQVSFALQNVPFPGWDGAGLRLEPMPVQTGSAKFDLELMLTEQDEQVLGRLEYSLDLFDETTAARIVHHLQQVLAAAAADPEVPIGRLPLMDQDQRCQVLDLGRGPTREWPGAGTVHEGFQDRAAVVPDAEAVRWEGGSLTYAELEQRANQLAHRLRDLGVGRDVVVGICMERSPEMVISLLAVLKAGGAYLPLDPEYPPARLAFMVQDAQVPVLLTQRRVLGTLNLGTLAHHTLCVEEMGAELARRSGLPPPVRVGGEDLAYVIYTSGSTGRPKGVMNVHAAIRNRLLWMQDAYRLGPDDRVLQKTPFSFDVSVWEFLWPLMTGACLVMARPGGHRDGSYLVGTISREQITTLHFVPSMLQLFLREDGVEDCVGLRRVLCSGEALSRELQDQFHARAGAELHNLYGPTEAAVDVSSWACRRDDAPGPVPIGRPIANTQLYVLDRHLQPVPPGAAGELCIGGRNLARGYLNRPDLTAERFVPHPFDPTPAARIYRTGDRARFRDDGALEYLGRLDHQVKLRGLRIELGEIEEVLVSHPAVYEAVVVTREQAGDTRLVAYLTGQALPGAGDLMAHLRRRLPEYMVPAVFVAVPALPLTPSGKVDRAALPEPQTARPDLAAPYRPPSDHTQQVLAAAWARVLGLEKVGVDDSFFDLGGHSLLLAELRAQLQQDLGRPLSMVELFQFPTVRTLAEKLDAVTDAPSTGRDGRDRGAARRQALARRADARPSSSNRSTPSARPARSDEAQAVSPDQSQEKQL